MRRILAFPADLKKDARSGLYTIRFEHPKHGDAIVQGLREDALDAILALRHGDKRKVAALTKAMIGSVR